MENGNQSAPPPKKSSSGRLGWVLVIVLVILIAVLVIAGGKIYLDTQQKLSALQTQLNGASGMAKEPTDQATIDRVSKHMVLPQETPKVITIQNVESLIREQPFFTKAKNGDILLVYTQKVILYDPSIDRIVDMAQIRLNAPSPTVSQ